jgi:hypothetical protein
MQKSFATAANRVSGSKLRTVAATMGVASRSERPRRITLENIRLRAYLKWEAAGKPDGDGSRFWLEAEEELLRGRCAQ